MADQRPDVLITYPVMILVDDSLMRHLLKMLVAKQVLTADEVDLVFEGAIGRCQRIADGPSVNAQDAGDAAALLALIRRKFRQDAGGG